MMDREGRADGRKMRRERDKCKDEERDDRERRGEIYVLNFACVRWEKRSPGIETPCERHDSIALGSWPRSFPKGSTTTVSPPRGLYVATSIEYVKRMMKRPYYARERQINASHDLLGAFACYAQVCHFYRIEMQDKTLISFESHISRSACIILVGHILWFFVKYIFWTYLVENNARFSSISWVSFYLTYTKNIYEWPFTNKRYGNGFKFHRPTAGVLIESQY